MPCRPLWAVDLNDPLAASQQCRGQSDTEAAGAFDSPQRRVVAPPEGSQLAVAGRIGGNRQTLQHSAGRADRAAVWVSLWVSTPMTTSRSRCIASMQFAPLGERTSIPVRATLRQDCDEPHPEADKLLIRPTRHPDAVKSRLQAPLPRPSKLVILLMAKTDNGILAYPVAGVRLRPEEWCQERCFMRPIQHDSYVAGIDDGACAEIVRNVLQHVSSQHCSTSVRCGWRQMCGAISDH